MARIGQFLRGVRVMVTLRPHVELHSFDADYVRRLREGDPYVEQDFISYFSKLLLIKLRSRLRSSDAVDDLRQETFARVLKTLRSETGIRQPERLGPFVVAVCNNVVLEHFRANGRYDQMPESEPGDQAIDLHGALVTREMQGHVKEVLEKLAPKDREILRAIFLEERDKEEVCRDFRVDRAYLRVLVHRAKQSFRARYEAKYDKDGLGAGRRT